MAAWLPSQDANSCVFCSAVNMPSQLPWILSRLSPPAQDGAELNPKGMPRCARQQDPAYATARHSNEYRIKETCTGFSMVHLMYDAPNEPSSAHLGMSQHRMTSKITRFVRLSFEAQGKGGQHPVLKPKSTMPGRPTSRVAPETVCWKASTRHSSRILDTDSARSS